MNQISKWQLPEGRDIILSPPLTLSWLWHLQLHLNQFKVLKFLSVLWNVPTNILAFKTVWCGVLGFSVVIFCWDFLSSAGIVNCINLLSTWTSAAVSTLGNLQSWRAKEKAEKRILQKGRSLYF